MAGLVSESWAVQSIMIWYKGPYGNPGPCSMKCADWRLLSLGLSVGEVGVGSAGGSVRSGASPRCSLLRSSELAIRDVGRATVGARLYPRRAVEGVENLVWRDKVLLTCLPSPWQRIA